MKSQRIQSEEKQSLVSPIAAAIISCVLPGVGQMLARAFGKGLTLLLSFASMVGLWIWRVNKVARRQPDFLAKIKKSLELHPILGFILALIILIYVWIIYDAYRTAKKGKVKSTILFILILIDRWVCC